MKLKFYPEKKLKKQIAEIISRYLNTQKYKVFIFGSRVEKRDRERSDIDVGIEGPKPISLEIIGQIKQDLANLPVLYSVDVVDFKRADDDFKKVAKKHCEFIS